MERSKYRDFSRTKPAARPTSSDSALMPLRRRRRVPIACASCRLRKRKCKHTSSKNNLQLPSRHDAGDFGYVHFLENKAELYEALLRSPCDRHEAIYQPANHSPSGSLSSAPAFHNCQQSETLLPLVRPSRTPDRCPAAIAAASPAPVLGVDGAISYAQIIHKAMKANAPSRAQLSTQLYPSLHGPSREMPDANYHDIPPHVYELLWRYFDFHHILTPIFHIPSILSRMEQVLHMERTRRYEDPLILAIIHMICAISAAHWPDGFDIPAVQSRKYYGRAMALVRPIVMSDWSVEKVQILLLGAQYLQNSDNHDESWTLLGLAIRIAQGLELHRPPPENLDCIQKEVRKRLWYACYTMDQLASTIYGMPVSTASNTFTTPLPEDLDDGCISPSQMIYPPTATLSTMSHSVQGVKLCRIIESALTLVDPPLGKIVELDEQFRAWNAQLPSALRIHEHESVLDEKKMIMAMKANLARILIHRHSVVQSYGLFARGERFVPPLYGLCANVMQNSRYLCVRSAEDTIQLVGRRHDITKAVTAPSLFHLYLLFHAILIIASHVVGPEFQGDKEALAHLEQGMRIIAQMSADHATARRTHVFLQQLLDLVEKALPQQSQPFVRKSSGTPTSSRAPQTQLPAPMAAEGAATGSDSYLQPSREFVQFWERTVELTTALSLQLDYCSSMSSNIWSWNFSNLGYQRQ